MRNLPYLASRLYGAPLAIVPRKLSEIHGAFQVIILGEAPKVDAALAKDQNIRKPYRVTTDGIAIIQVLGPLVSRDTGNFMSGGPTTYSEIRTEFEDAATDPAVKGILLDLDSPGGEVGGLFDLAALIADARSMKPVYAVANESAFSAAYAIASSAERIYMTQTGGVGSVGVVAMHVDQSGYDQKIGAQYTYLYAGARKIDGNPHAPLTEEAAAVFQAEIDRCYGIFTDAVAKNRGLTVAAVKSTEAGCFFGEDAIENGLADKIGTLEDAHADMLRAIQAPKSVRMAASASQIKKEAKTMATEKQPDATEETKAAETETTTEAAEAKKETAEPKAEQPKVAEPANEAAAPGADVIKAAEERGRIAGKADFQKYSAGVKELCAIARRPDLMDGFIEKGLSLDSVRTELFAALATQSDDTAIHSSPNVASNAGPANQLQAEADRIQASEKVDKHKAMALAVERNPKLYREAEAARRV